MVVRRVLTLTLSMLGCWSVLLANPAGASHDDHGPGTVIIEVGGASASDVVVVFPPDADEDRIRTEVERAAADAGLELRGVGVVDNTDPDTRRVRGDLRLAERTGSFAYRLPAEHIRAWAEVDGVERLVVTSSRWARGAGIEPGGEVEVDGSADLEYRLSRWPIAMVLLLTILAGVVPYVALRLYGRSVVRRDEPVADRLHRLRRATVVAQLLVISGVAAALILGGVVEGVAIGLMEVFDGHVPRAAAAVASVVAWLVPLLVVIAATAAAVVPYDRELRATDQTIRAGAGEAVRLSLLVFIPIGLWVLLLTWAPGGDGWSSLVRLAIFLPLVVVLSPVLMNKVLRTRPVDEDLRARVLSRCEEQGLAVRDVRMLDSRGGKVANAAISGVVPRLRYVYLTDHLVEVLDDDELDAVLAHEIAHGEGHHIILKVLAGLLGVAVAGGLLVLALIQLDLSGRWIVPVIGLGTPLMLVTVLLLAQGVVGVRLEQRADDRAVQQVGAGPMLRALETLADTNQIKRRTGWLWNVMQQHPGMEQRIERLRAVAGDEPATGSEATGSAETDIDLRDADVDRR